MGLLYNILTLAVLGLIVGFLSLNGYLGPDMQKAAEDFILKQMGESRGSYFLKNMTPLKNQPLNKQTDAIVDAGQGVYASGIEKPTSDVGTGLRNGMGNTVQGVGDLGSGAFKGVQGDPQALGDGVRNGVSGVVKGLGDVGDGLGKGLQGVLGGK